MKKLLCILATKMQPGLVQNIIGRLGSKSPKLFITIQKNCAVIISALTAVLGAVETDTIQVPHKTAVLIVLGFFIALFTGIGGGAALTTTDTKYIAPDVKEKVINESDTN